MSEEDVNVNVVVWSDNPVGTGERMIIEDCFMEMFAELASKVLLALSEVDGKWKMNGCLELVKEEK